MRRLTTLALALLLVAGAAVIFVQTTVRASNQIFKIDYPLYAAGAALPEGGTSASGENSICLPYLRYTGIDNASDLAGDIDGQAGVSVVSSISRQRPIDNGRDTYDGTAPTDFPLAAGIAYRVVVSQNVTYTLIGSHDPGVVITLLGASDAESQNGTNSFCPPYHTTSSNASELLDEIVAAAGNSAAVSSIARFLRASDSIETYTGFNQATNFDLAPGEGYQVVVQDTVEVVPEHR